MFKVGEEYLKQILQTITFTGNIAYERTDEDGDAEYIVMPVFAATTKTNIAIPPEKKVQIFSRGDFEKLDSHGLTAKAQAYRQYLQQEAQ